MFEIIKRDGLARIGKFETRSGTLETPALLPVVNPKIFTVTPRELYDEFGFRALITNSYIIKNNAKVKNHYETILKWWMEDSNIREPDSDELAAIQRMLRDG